MDDAVKARFGPGVRPWIDGIGSVRDVVRQVLVARQLSEHLPTNLGPLEVLDAGCGQGTQAIALARLGHHVTGLDSSEQLLAEAERAAREQPAEVRERLRFERGDVLTLGESRPGRYDVVCCHGVAMYLPSLAELVGQLVTIARSGALISLLTRNRAGIAMRAGMTGQWAAALEGFDASHYTNRLGIKDARAEDPVEVRSTVELAGANPVAWYGVRLFSDHWDREASIEDLDALIAAEEQAGRRDPYRALAALTHTLAIVG